MALTDTSLTTAQMRAEVFRKMSAAEKALAVEQMSEDARELARCGIRMRHSGYSAEETEHALHRLLVGDDLADRAWPTFSHLRP